MIPRYKSFQDIFIDLHTRIKNLKEIEKLILIQDWPEGTKYDYMDMAAEYSSLWIFPPEGFERQCLAICTRLTKKMQRRFRESDGDFYYEGNLRINIEDKWTDLTIYLERVNALHPECKIIPYTERVTKYRPECQP